MLRDDAKKKMKDAAKLEDVKPEAAAETTKRAKRAKVYVEVDDVEEHTASGDDSGVAHAVKNVSQPPGGRAASRGRKKPPVAAKEAVDDQPRERAAVDTKQKKRKNAPAGIEEDEEDSGARVAVRKTKDASSSRRDSKRLKAQDNEPATKRARHKSVCIKDQQSCTPQQRWWRQRFYGRDFGGRGELMSNLSCSQIVDVLSRPHAQMTPLQRQRLASQQAPRFPTRCKASWKPALQIGACSPRLAAAFASATIPSSQLRDGSRSRERNSSIAHST